MPDRRRFLAIVLAALGAPAVSVAAPAPAPEPGAAVRIVGGWVLTDRDVAAIARLAR